MKLLIVTQVVDENHPILGFFCKWISAFSGEVESIEVICLEEGNHTLPDNVTVHSLGKEKGIEKRVVYIWRYMALLWKLRKKYDGVLTHMNPEYTIVGYPIWALLRKEIGMWYAHGAVSSRLHISTWMSKMVFTSTPQGFRLGTPKRKIVGQGIDANLFALAGSADAEDVLQLVTVGRMTAVKNIDTLLQACALLKERGVSFIFSIVGVAVTDPEKKYEKEMYALSHKLDLDKQIVFVGGVKQSELPALLQKADVFIHDGQTGSLDKVLLEAMASGAYVLSSNESYKVMMENTDQSTVYTTEDSEALADMVQEFLTLPKEKKENIIKVNRKLVETEHSLVTFVQKIVSEYTT